MYGTSLPGEQWRRQRLDWREDRAVADVAGVRGHHPVRPVAIREVGKANASRLGFLGAASFDAGIRSLTRAGGGRSSTATSGCGGCRRTKAQSTGRFGGVHRTRIQACEAKPSKGEATSQWPTAASWLWSFQSLGSNHSNRRHMRTDGNCIGSIFQASRSPRSFGPLLQSIPRLWGVMKYRNGIGATTPTSAAEGAARQDHVDLALRCTPRKQDNQEQARVFTSNFPSLV